MGIILTITFISCNNEINYSEVVLDNNNVNKLYLENIQLPERALLSWYLYAYGNECTDDSDKNKCILLETLKIKNECSVDHINFLNKWLSANKLISYKLKKKCPILPVKGSIKNKIDYLKLTRISDTLSILIKVKGMNNAEEKTWDIEQEDAYRIDGNTLVKI